MNLLGKGIWVAAARGSTNLLSLLKVVILTHWLGPEEFGLFGLSLLVIDLFMKFSTPGFRPALIHMKQGAEEYLDTAWSITILRNYECKHFFK